VLDHAHQLVLGEAQLPACVAIKASMHCRIPQSRPLCKLEAQHVSRQSGQDQLASLKAQHAFGRWKSRPQVWSHSLLPVRRVHWVLERTFVELGEDLLKLHWLEAALVVVHKAIRAAVPMPQLTSTSCSCGTHSFCRSHDASALSHR
jgi:hypothetical protein